MRFALLLALASLACTSDPTDQNPPPPQDAQPFDLAADATGCADACGVGFFCQGTRCVGEGDLGAPEDRPQVVDLGTPDAGSPMDVQRADVGTDAGAVGACGDASVDLRAGTLLSTGVFTNCGGCGVTCTRQQRCSAGACAVRCPSGPTAMCDGRNVSLGTGETDGGLVHYCGACNVTCAAGEVCDACICAR